MKITTTMNLTEITAAIASIARRGKALDADIQSCALSIAAHHQAHGDWTKANELFLAMPRGSRRNALVEWFVEFGGLAVNMDKATAKEQPFTRTKETAAKINVAAGAEKPWYDCKPEKDPIVEFDIAAAIAQLVARAEKAAAGGATVKGADMLEQLKKLAPKAA